MRRRTAGARVSTRAPCCRILGMDPLLPLAPTEWLLMRCVWDLGTANALQVSEHLREHYGRSHEPSTVGILLSRLVGKGYLSRRLVLGLVGRGRPPLVYDPAIPFETGFRAQVERFLNEYQVDAESVAEVLETIRAEREQPLKRHRKRRR